MVGPVALVAVDVVGWIAGMPVTLTPVDWGAGVGIDIGVVDGVEVGVGDVKLSVVGWVGADPTGRRNAGAT